MAHEPFEKAVFNHPRIAMVTGNLMATGAADGDGRIAATVEEQQALLAKSNAFRHRPRQGIRHEPCRGQFFRTQVKRVHIGHHRRAKAAFKVETRVLSRLDIGP